jgi:hypothetical protein
LAGGQFQVWLKRTYTSATILVRVVSNRAINEGEIFSRLTSINPERFESWGDKKTSSSGQASVQASQLTAPIAMQTLFCQHQERVEISATGRLTKGRPRIVDNDPRAIDEEVRDRVVSRTNSNFFLPVISVTNQGSRLWSPCDIFVSY